jgi:hypothetical protein
MRLQTRFPRVFWCVVACGHVLRHSYFDFHYTPFHPLNARFRGLGCAPPGGTENEENEKTSPQRGIACTGAP